MSIDAAGSRVFLLVQTDPGRVSDAEAFLRTTAGITDVAATSGPFDLIATAHVTSTSGLDRLVSECRRAPGLARLNRCHTVGT
jgi:hypothetical protein